MQKQPILPDYFLDIRFPDDRGYLALPPYLQRDREIVALHCHPAPEFGYCLEGTGIFCIGGRIFNFHAGDAVFIARNEPHLAQSAPDTVSRWHWAYADPERVFGTRFPELDARKFNRMRGEQFENLRREPELCGLIRRFCGGLTDPVEIPAVLALILLALQRAAADFLPEDSDAAETGGDFERLRPALAYFNTHYAEKISMLRAARLCALSPTQFRRRFRRTLGTSPLRYLNSLRVRMALPELELGEKNVADIAEACGFPSASGLQRQCRRLLNRPPRRR